MAPEDPFAGINPERLAMMQSINAPLPERGGRGGRGGGSSDRSGRMRGGDRNGYRRNGRHTQGNRITFGKDGVQNGNGNGIVGAGEETKDSWEETSALQRRAEKKNGGKKVEEKEVEEVSKVIMGEKGDRKNKRKRDDEMEVCFGVCRD